MIIDVAPYLHYIYVVWHVIFTLCPYCNDIALVLWLYYICTFNCKWYNVVTIWLQTLSLYWFYIVFMLSIFCICVVLIFFQHCICIAYALLNITYATLQQHNYKLDIQYSLNVVFLLLILLYMTRSQITGWNPLEGFTKSNCGNCDLAARSRLPTLKRGRGSSWEPKD
jgi:hypothetical protein